MCEEPSTCTLDPQMIFFNEHYSERVQQYPPPGTVVYEKWHMGNWSAPCVVVGSDMASKTIRVVYPRIRTTEDGKCVILGQDLLATCREHWKENPLPVDPYGGSNEWMRRYPLTPKFHIDEMSSHHESFAHNEQMTEFYGTFAPAPADQKYIIDTIDVHEEKIRCSLRTASARPLLVMVEVLPNLHEAW